MKSGEPLRGIGMFGRLGYAPKATNTLTRHGSLALFARGLWDRREYDSFGVGFYYNAVNGEFKDDIKQLTAGTTVKNEKGIEVFYDFAITPAVRVIPSYQYVRDPLTAQVVANHRSANLFLLRFTVAL
jgi:porin